MIRNSTQSFSNRFAAFAFTMIALTACGSSNPNSSGTPDGTEVSAITDGGNLNGDPTSTHGSSSFSLQITDTSNLTAAQVTKVNQAAALDTTILKSAAFKTKVLNFTYQGVKQFVQNNGLTNQQIYDTLMAAAEQYPNKTAADGIAQMKIKIYFPPWYSTTSAIAFTSTTDDYLNIYSSYFSSSSIGDLAETIVHEWTHKLGFDHDYDATAQRPYSVPYGIGGIVSSLANL